MDSGSSSRTSYPLQRGTACLACRRRKMKCDGTKPVCTQCTKAGRGADCEYDDGKAKTRTQLLQEKISLLEGKIRDLESVPQDSASSTSSHHMPSFPQPLHGSPPTFFDDGSFSAAFDPTMFSMSNPITTEIHPMHVGLPGEVASSSRSTPARDPFTAHPRSDPWDVGMPMGIIDTANVPWDMPGFNHAGSEPERWWDQEELPPRMRDMLVDIFLPHRHQAAFEADPEQFKASLNLPPAQRPHRALLNAIYLSACHFSGTPQLSQHEPLFLERTRKALAEALANQDRLINYIQASSILAAYFLGKGRLLEGHHLASATARLAVGCGLNKITVTPPSASSLGPDVSPAVVASRTPGRRHASLIPPPTTPREIGERVYAFWSVHNLDRFWSVAVGLPTALIEEEIETAWPRNITDYDSGAIFTDASSVVRPDTTPSLLCKAVALFESASRLHAYLDPTNPSEEFWDGFRLIQQSIVRLSSALPPIRQFERERGGAGEELEMTRNRLGAPLPSLLLLHTLTCAVAIQLHSIFAMEDAACYTKCLEAARAANGVIRQNQDVDVTCCDAMLGPCWLLVAEVLIRELIRWKGLGDVERVKSVHIEVEGVMFMMKRLGMVFPLVELQATKVETSLSMAIQGEV